MKYVFVKPLFKLLLNQKGKSLLIQILTLVLVSSLLAGLYFYYQPVSAQSKVSQLPKADSLADRFQVEGFDSLNVLPDTSSLVAQSSLELSGDPLRTPAEAVEKVPSEVVSASDVLPLKGQYCNIQNNTGWKWSSKQQCPMGTSIVSNAQKACPQGSSSIGQGCFVSNNSEMGKQVCPDGDPSGQCCFYPCQEQPQSIPAMRCTQAMMPSSYSSETKGCMVYYACKFLDSEFVNWGLQPPEGAYVEDKALCRSNVRESCEPGVDCSTPRAQFKCSLAGAEWETNNPPNDALWVDQCKLTPEESKANPQ